MSRVKVDVSQYDRMVSLLTGDVAKARLSAIRSGSNLLRKKTEQNFGAVSNFKRFNIYKDRYGSKKKLRLVSVVLNKKEEKVTVSILSDFRAKFIELGTKERKTTGKVRSSGFRVNGKMYYSRSGKPRRTGRIVAKYPFMKAQDETKDKILSEMEDRVKKAIIRIGKKKL